MRGPRTAVLSLVALAFGVGALALPIASGEPAGPARPTAWTDDQKIDAKPVVRKMEEQGRRVSLKTISRRYSARQADLAHVPSSASLRRGPTTPSSTTAVPEPSRVFEGSGTPPRRPYGSDGEVLPAYVEAVNTHDGAFMACSIAGEVLAEPAEERLWEKWSFAQKAGGPIALRQVRREVDRHAVRVHQGEEIPGSIQCIAVRAGPTHRAITLRLRSSKDELPDTPSAACGGRLIHEPDLFAGNRQLRQGARIIRRSTARTCSGQRGVGCLLRQREPLGLPGGRAGATTPPAGAEIPRSAARRRLFASQERHLRCSSTWLIGTARRSEVSDRYGAAEPFDLVCEQSSPAATKGSDRRLDALGGHGTGRSSVSAAYRNFGTTRA